MCLPCVRATCALITESLQDITFIVRSGFDHCTQRFDKLSQTQARHDSTGNNIINKKPSAATTGGKKHQATFSSLKPTPSFVQRAAFKAAAGAISAAANDPKYNYSTSLSALGLSEPAFAEKHQKKRKAPDNSASAVSSGKSGTSAAMLSSNSVTSSEPCKTGKRRWIKVAQITAAASGSVSMEAASATTGEIRASNAVPPLPTYDQVHFDIV
jgi:hypothetical protein